MQIVKYVNMSSYCLIILAIFYLQQPLENYNNLAILLPTKKLQGNCNEHLVQGVNYAFDVENFFGSYKSCDLSSVVLSPYLGSGIPRNDFVNESIIFFEYHNQLLTMSQYFNKDPERLRIDTYLCVQDPFCLNQNVAKSINGSNTEYLEYCLANVFSIFNDPFEILPMKVNETKHVEPSGNLNGRSEKPQQLDNEKQQHVSFAFIPSRNDIKAIIAHKDYSQSLGDNLQIFKYWSKCYIYVSPQEENRSLSKDSSKCEDIKSWFISGSTNLWTSRYHQKTHDRTFMEYRMDQTECLYKARTRNPLYSVVFVFGNGPSSANRFGSTTKSNETPTSSGKGFTFKAKITEDLTNMFLSPVAATKTVTTGFNACAAAFRNTSASDSALKSANNVFAAPAEQRPISPATRRLQK
uniref:Monkey King protein C-terminal domain-containing protein n=1 Tax=Glossina palpalis gambiensis TaxID=67801 RepID=A0A1B0BLG2_9MUSC